MADYRIMGARYLRKYSEAGSSPVTAAAIEAQRIVNTLCDLPWERVADKHATMTSHLNDDQSLNGNVENRDRFDAANFCAYHEGGMHRAYANAAVYAYELPDSAVGKSAETVKCQVNTDYYNSQGVRLHVWTGPTLEIPMSCRTVRGENTAGEIVDDGTTAAGVAKRTTRIVDRQEMWYTTSETVTLEPTGGLTLQKYLFLLVALESYSTVRGNWLEGSSYIDNDVILTLDSPCEDLDVTRLNDLSPAPPGGLLEFNVVKGGVTQSNYGAVSGLYGIEVLANGDSLDDVPKSSNGVYDPADVDRCNASGVFENQVIGLRTLYARFYEGKIVQIPRSMNDRLGAGFRVGTYDKAVQVCDGDGTADGTFRLWRMSMSSLAVSFSVPTMFEADKIRLEWPNWLQPYKATGRFNVWLMRGQFLEALPDAVLKNPDIYIGGNSSVAGWEMLGTIDAAVFYDTSIRSKTFSLSEPLVGRVATLLITAYASADGYNPEGSAGEYANGTMRVGVDSANNALVDYDATGGADLFKPDITLLGYGEVDDGENPGDGETYTATLDGGGGTGGDSSAAAVYGADMPALEAVPTKTYNTFQGYYDATTGGTRYYGPDGVSAHVWDKTSSATLYARWRPFRVTFDANGGSVTPPYADVDGTTGKVTLPTPTLPEGSLFAGWYTAADGGTNVGDAGGEYSPQGDITLYAHVVRPLCFTALANGSTIEMCTMDMFHDSPSSYAPAITLLTSSDGTTWTPFVVGETTITLASVGDKVYFRAGSTGNSSLSRASGEAWNSFVITTGLVAASGDVTSLLDPEGAVLDLTGRDWCFNSLFRGCTSLVAAPELPATTLANYCYTEMFYGCTSLTSAPELPATTMEESCYNNMFRGCTSLTAAPELPAMTLANSCYYAMFKDCTSLTSLAVYFAAFSPANATTSWLTQVPSNGTFRCPTALANSGFTRNGGTVPDGWTIETFTP